jgi:putative copper export protein
MTGLEAVSIVLRWLLYIATVSCSGGILFRLSFPAAAAKLEGPLARQICLGSLAVLIVETFRLTVFQLEAGGGDWTRAFAPDLRFMAFSTGFGYAVLLRAVSAILVLFGGRFDARIPSVGAALMIGSYALEGHTADVGGSVLPPLILLVHVIAVHWWIGALPPLFQLSRGTNPDLLRETVEGFGRRAPWIVALLVLAGASLFALLSGGTIDPTHPYQQRLALKLLLVLVVLALAALNKFVLTPQLRTPSRVQIRAALSRSIRLETCFAAGILLATAVMLARAPSMD